MLLFFSDRGLHFFLLRNQLTIKHAKVDAVRLFGQFPRILHVAQQSDVCAPRHVHNRLPVRRVVHQLVERLLHIVACELLTLLRVVRDVPSDVGRRVEADRAVDFHEPHSSVQVEPEQLPEHYVVFLRNERADQFTAERTRSSEVLGTQVVLLFAGDFGIDCHHLRGEWIIFVSVVQLWWVLQVHLEDKTLFHIEHTVIE